jgi:cyclase
VDESRRLRLALAGVAALAMGWALPALAVGPAPQSAPSPPVGVLQVRPDVYMLTVDGENIVLGTGPEGAVVVDSGPASAAAAVLATIRQLTKQPIRYVIQTNADLGLVGGSSALSDAGKTLLVGWAPLLQHNNDIDKVPLDQRRAAIVARQNVLAQLSADQGVISGMLPNETFTRPQYNFRLNGQAVEVIRMPPAHSDGDSVVMFRRSDVVVTGDIFDDTHFPVIDLQHGGSIQGEIAAVNQVMNTLTVYTEPVVSNAAGTLVIPVRGVLCDQSDLLTFRDMLDAVEHRVAYLVSQGRSLAQVEAANPTAGYNTRYGSDSGSWTTRDFVDAVYRSLQAERQARRHGRKG